MRPLNELLRSEEQLRDEAMRTVLQLRSLLQQARDRITLLETQMESDAYRDRSATKLQAELDKTRFELAESRALCQEKQMRQEEIAVIMDQLTQRLVQVKQEKAELQQDNVDMARQLGRSPHDPSRSRLQQQQEAQQQPPPPLQRITFEELQASLKPRLEALVANSGGQVSRPVSAPPQPAAERAKVQKPPWTKSLPSRQRTQDIQRIAMVTKGPRKAALTQAEVVVAGFLQQSESLEQYRLFVDSHVELKEADQKSAAEEGRQLRYPCDCGRHFKDMSALGAHRRFCKSGQHQIGKRCSPVWVDVEPAPPAAASRVAPAATSAVAASASGPALPAASSIASSWQEAPVPTSLPAYGSHFDDDMPALTDADSLRPPESLVPVEDPDSMLVSDEMLALALSTLPMDFEPAGSDGRNSSADSGGGRQTDDPGSSPRGEESVPSC